MKTNTGADEAPAIMGIVIGVIYFVDPMRALRLATTAAGLLQSALSAWTAYRIVAARAVGRRSFRVNDPYQMEHPCHR